MERLSRRLAWLLRHGAKGQGLKIDSAGWVEIRDVASFLSIDPNSLALLVSSDAKQRFQIDGSKIRCCQGHSIGSGVSLEALEASWSRFYEQGLIWHGTREEAVPVIACAGITAQRRTHVHLAPALSSVVGKRAHVEVMLAVDPGRVRSSGGSLWCAPNGVILARWIPASAIVWSSNLTQDSLKLHSV